MKNHNMPVPLSPGMWPDEDYEIKKVMGQDFVSICYLAHHSLLDCDVLLREFMPAHCSYRTPDGMIAPLPGMENVLQDCYNDFVERMRLFFSIQHPHLSSIRTAFCGLTGTIYGVQSVATGKMLSSAIAPTHTGEKLLLPLLEQALDVLSYLSQKKLCPIDLTPQCFVLDDKELKMNLLGNVRGESESAVAGTPGYTPVEYVQGCGGAGPWSVMYSLGAVFYQFITGKVPTPATDRLGKVDSYVPLAAQPALQSRYSLHFLSSVDKALALWAEDRWPSYAEWQQALKEIPKDSVLPGAGSAVSGGLRLGGSGGELRLGAGYGLTLGGGAKQPGAAASPGLRLGGGSGLGGGMKLGR